MARKFRERFKTMGNVFDNFTIRNLFELSSRDFFEEDTMMPISIGKEANVFAAQKDDGFIVLKIYRLENADFNKMYEYIKVDPRYIHLAKRRREIIFAWAQREYRNLMAARKAQIRAPLPITFMKNILIIEFIGDDTPAPNVKDKLPKDPQAFYDECIKQIKKFYKAGFVHGDLSKFNILNHNEMPVLIDFSQASPIRAPHSGDMLKRDLKNVSDFLEKLGAKTNPENIHKQLTRSSA